MPPRKPFWHRLHPAYIVYVVLIALIVNIALGELQAIVTNGFGAVFDGDWDFAQLRATATGRFASAQPVVFGVALALLLALAVVGWLHDRRLKQPTGKLPLARARDLDRTSAAFRMGDDAAATFPYVEAPVHDAFAQATATLAAAAARRSPKRGILVLGEANAGKTRLALEAVIATLPKWSVLLWSPSYSSDAAPPAETLRGRKLVIFVNDLPDYVNTPAPVPGSSSSATGFAQSAALADPAATLRTLIADAQAAAGKRGRVLIAATCRSEGLDRAKSGLAELFDELDQVHMPAFADADRDRIAGGLEAAARATHDRPAADAVRIADWDGTLGSLILGLARRQQEYEQLRAAGSPAVPVLHAMKLLTLCGILAHTEPRLRAVCAAVFGQPALRDDPAVWRAALADLTRLQFVGFAADPDSGDSSLVIRKDAYLEKVITGYPDPAQPQQLDQDRGALLPVFTALGDFPALFSLGNACYHRDRFAEALACYDAALRLRPDDPDTLYNKGVTLSKLGRPDEALACYDAALRLRPDDPDTLHNKGVALFYQHRYLDALACYDASLRLRPDDVATLSDRGEVLFALARLDNALADLAHALALDPAFRDDWHARALATDPTTVAGWHARASILRALGRHAEAAEAEARAAALEGR